MKDGGIVYLDHAATSYPKHPDVIREMRRAMTVAGGNPGRSAHPLAVRAAEMLYECREEAAALFDVPSPEQVVFTMNTTYALNMAIKGLIRRGDHVLISDFEHNAVWRPVESLRRQGRVTYDLFPGDISAAEVTETLAVRVRPNTRAVICTAASNICPIQPPIREIGTFCRSRGILLIVDGAQLAGHGVLSLRETNADAIAVPGHKGLGGPQGIGVLLLREGILPEPILDGGTGVLSLDRTMPDFLPERLEAGTLPMPAAAGLLAALRCLKRDTLAARAAEESDLARLLRERLQNDGRIRLFGDGDGTVFSFQIPGITPQEIGKRLGERGICVRTGFHCAPLAHRTLGTGKSGTVRVSIGYTNTKADIRHFSDELTKIEAENTV